MYNFGKNIVNFIEARKGFKTGLENQLKTMQKDSDDARSTRVRILYNERMIKELASSFVLTPPQLTFSDKLTLKMDDITVNLVYFGKSHTESDILIHVPEEGILMIGDLGGIQLTPGEEQVVQKWISSLESVLEDKENLKHVIGGHNFLDLEYIASYYDQIKNLWERIKGKTSAVLVMQKTLESAGIDAALTQFKELKEKNSGKYYFEPEQFFNWAVGLLQSESFRTGIEIYILITKEFQQWLAAQSYMEGFVNRVAYSFLEDNLNDDAIRVLQASVHVFPDSWNIYNSLADAYMKKGDKEQTVKYYKKSLKLNPDNSNAKEMLKKLDKTDRN